jgi:hypothetical protein
MKMQVSIEIAAPAEKIWPYIVEPEKILKWADTVKKIHFTGDRKSGLDTCFYFEERAASPLIKLNLVVTEWVQNERISFKMTSSNLVKDYEQKYTLEAIPSGCRLNCYEDVRLPYGIAGRFIGIFRQPISVMYLNRIFLRLKKLAEE